MRGVIAIKAPGGDDVGRNLAQEVLATMRAHAERAWPEECVGALLSDGATVVPLQNVASDRRSSFRVSARESIRLEQAAEAKGLSVLGFYHSHPDGPAVPSAADVESAAGRWMFIIQVSGGVAGMPRPFRASPLSGRGERA